MSEWQSEYLLKYIMSPLTKLSTNILDVYLEAGTETILHYLANAYYVIAETKI